MSKKCTPLWREAHVEVKMLKAPHVRTTFWRSDVVLRDRRKRFCTLPRVSKMWGFVAFPKTMAGVGRLKRIWKDALRVAGAKQETCSSEMLGGQGADFLRGVAFWSIRSSGLLRWFCVTGAALRMTWHHFCVAGAALYTDGVEKLVRGRQKSRRIASFLMLSTSKIEEVSQNCFVFDVVNFENWGSLAELHRFWRCQVENLRMSRRISSFLMLSSSNIEEVSQNCGASDVVKSAIKEVSQSSFVFELAER